jgi:putative aldouronate transport system substrate-binding protein
LFKKLWVILIFVGLLMVCLIGCTKDTSNEESDSSSSGGATPLKIFTSQYPDFDMKTNSYTKYVEDTFNVAIDWQFTTLDPKEANEKRQISLASGNLPDVYMTVSWVDTFKPSELQQYGKDGAIIPLNDLIDKHAPNIKKAFEEHPEFKLQATAPDGNIYGLPQLIECYHCSYVPKMWINSDWLEKLNLEMPKTTEEFKNVLKAFKTQDPNGNGKADEIPLSGSNVADDTLPIGFFMNGFIYDDMKTRLLLKNGKVDFAANKDEWKEGLEYVHSLYKDGLIDPGAFTQNMEAYKQVGDHPDSILGVAPAMHPRVFSADPKRHINFDPLAPLEGPYAAYATYQSYTKPGANFVITHKASKEAQIAAIKLVDNLFTTEGALRGFFGEENVDWKKAQDGDVAVNEKVEPVFAEIPYKGKMRNTNWKAIAQYYNPVEFYDSQVQGMDIYTDEGYARRLQEATYLYDGKEPEEVFPYWTLWIDPEVADEHAMLETNIKNHINQWSLQFITGEKSLEKDWDEYLQGFKKLDLNRYIEIMQETYDKSK